MEGDSQIANSMSPDDSYVSAREIANEAQKSSEVQTQPSIIHRDDTVVCNEPQCAFERFW